MVFVDTWDYFSLGRTGVNLVPRSGNMGDMDTKTDQRTDHATLSTLLVSLTEPEINS